MMIFLNLRRTLITLLFLAGAGTLLLGYGGAAGFVLQEPAAVKSPVQITPSPGYNPGDLPAAGDTAGKDGFFVEYRMVREKSRSRQVEILKEILNSPSAAAETRQLVQEQLMEISKNAAGETRLESILKARGYREAVVSMDQKGVTVVVDGKGVNPPEEAGIMEIVSKETGIGEQGIIIIPRN